MEKKDIKKTYWGLLKYQYSYTKGKREIAVFKPEMTLNDCCCAEDGYVLYDTKKEAKRNKYGAGWEKEKLVKFTVEVLTK